MTGGARWALREATGDAHARLDAAFARFDLADPAAYREFLLAHRAALPPLEAAVQASGAAWEGWSPRAAALDADLHDLGGPELDPPTPDRSEPRAPLSAPRAWGVQYVLEGSRLGGGLLAGRLAPGTPRRYLADPQPAGAWPRFQAALDAGLGAAGDAALAQALEGAHFAFARFQAAADAA